MVPVASMDATGTIDSQHLAGFDLSTETTMPSIRVTQHRTPASCDSQGRRRTRRVWPVLGALLLFGLGSTAQAALDPALVSGSVFFDFSPPDRLNFNTFGTHPLTGPGGSVSFSALAQPGPYLSGEVSVSQGFTGRSSGTLLYALQVLGLAGDVSVLVDVFGRASASSTTTDPFAGFAMKAQWRLEDVTLGLQPVFEEGINTPALQGSFDDSFGHTVELELTAGHLYRVTLVADAFAAAGSTGVGAFASAFIDPAFRFGPGVGSEYSIVLSEGIGNVAPVPEPSAVVLAAAGIVALGLRRAGARRLR